jgi:hypothetical protein
MNVAHLKFHEDSGKWKAHFKGVMLCQSQDKYRVIREIESGNCRKANELGVTQVSEEEPHVNMNPPARKVAVAHPVVTVQKPHFTIAERFEFLEMHTFMVIDGVIPSMVVTGSAGLGKTHTVLDCYNQRGLQNALSFLTEKDGEVNDDIADMGDYMYIKGFSTAKGLYRTLYQNRNRSVVFDDCDKVLEDKVAINILKGALDSSEQRFISWNAELPEDSDVPRYFEFKGGVIFISNKTQDALDGAIKSRCARVDVTMTTDEKLERMHQVLHKVMPELPMSIKQEALQFLHEKKDVATDLNMRTLIYVCKMVNGNNPNWRRAAEYGITA